MRLESAPIPVTRNGGSDLGLIHGGLGILSIHALGVGTKDANLLSIDGILDFVQTVGTVLFPTLVGAPAQIAGTGGDTIGMEAGILVEGNEVRCVGRAEDVATVTAVVAAQEEAK